ncbi:MAG: rhamnulokinase [Oscillospiraceae bacterium]|nr:rhamnulokinase [Oscillospiraceae bacterium]
MPYYLAIDIGASSGRHIIGGLEDGKLVIREVYRFKNGFVKKNGRLCWESDALFENILAGIAKCGEVGKIPAGVGIDTWGVDFALLDEAGGMIGDAVAYRDSRTDGMDKVADAAIGEDALYARTGIQKMSFNTIYQMLALRTGQPELLEKAKGFLLTPEYYSYLLCGVKKHEQTIASTTGLVSAATREWDFDLIEKLGLPAGLFGEIVKPGTKLGPLRPEIAERVGFSCDVIFPCTHDTGSAVVAAPLDEDSLYLSSGTWSLMGAELHQPICTEESRVSALTNEGGFGNRYRCHKNIMGLWILQSIKAETGDVHNYADLRAMAEAADGFPSRIDVNAPRFMAPDSMVDEIKTACAESGQQVPETLGQLTYLVYQSLAGSYAQTVAAIERLTGKNYTTIRIVGGGSQDSYLNALTAKACGKKVTAGPVEGTAIGNILVQMMAMGEIGGIDEARQLVKRSFPLETYQ